MTAQHSPSPSHPAEAGRVDPRHALVAAFLDHLRGPRPSRTLPLYSYGGAARHFLLWLNRHRIPLACVDNTVVDRFARHRCRCSGYSAHALAGAAYVSRVRRFVRFLEDRGDIPVVD